MQQPQKNMGNSNTAINEFSGNTTAEQAARNADLTGKWAIVTGCSAGIGVETVRVLLMHNCNVVMACRDEQKMAKVAQELSAANKGTGKLEQMQVELSSLKSVRKFAQDFIAKKLPIHLLILNAGVMACPYKKTEDGFEMQIGTNVTKFLLLIIILALGSHGVNHGIASCFETKRTCTRHCCQLSCS